MQHTKSQEPTEKANANTCKPKEITTDSLFVSRTPDITQSVLRASKRVWESAFDIMKNGLNGTHISSM